MFKPGKAAVDEIIIAFFERIQGKVNPSPKSPAATRPSHQHPLFVGADSTRIATSDRTSPATGTFVPRRET